MPRPDNEQMQQYRQQHQQVLHELQQRQAEQQVNQVMEAPQQVRQVQTDTPVYDGMFRHLASLPPDVPVAGGPVPRAERVGYKEKKRQKKAYQALSRQQRLMSEADLKTLPQFRTREGVERWANETLPHSTLTRGDTLKQVLDRGDYSNFENLDGISRNIVASQAISRLERTYHITEDSDPQDICQQIQRTGPGVSALLDPGLRLALSLAQRDDAFQYSPGLKKFFQELDEAMSTAVMTATLTTKPDYAVVREACAARGAADPDADAEKTINANRYQQVQIAKRLLLMQISNFQKVTSNADGSARSEDWDKSIAVALSHCSRVAFTLPRQEGDGANSEFCQKAMYHILFNDSDHNAAQDNPRGSSTHSIRRRTVNEAGVGSEEKKVLFNLVGQRGMDCAIGGLGNVGISGKTILNDGSCGHFYSMYKEADASHYGAILMGLESDHYGVTNQMGHTHDIHATAEKASSLGGQRTDEVGNKYGGRQCDLTHTTADNIYQWMMLLEAAMASWYNSPDGMSDSYAKQAMSMLTGKKLDQNGLRELSQLLHESAGSWWHFDPEI